MSWWLPLASFWLICGVTDKKTAAEVHPGGGSDVRTSDATDP
jgi:hypothetical protein